VSGPNPAKRLNRGVFNKFRKNPNSISRVGGPSSVAITTPLVAISRNVYPLARGTRLIHRRCYIATSIASLSSATRGEYLNRAENGVDVVPSERLFGLLFVGAREPLGPNGELVGCERPVSRGRPRPRMVETLALYYGACVFFGPFLLADSLHLKGWCLLWLFPLWFVSMTSAEYVLHEAEEIEDRKSSIYINLDHHPERPCLPAKIVSPYWLASRFAQTSAIL
jgi:hypothetical protein